MMFAKAKKKEKENIFESFHRFRLAQNMQDEMRLCNER